MNEQGDVRQTARLRFAMETAWVSLPKSFPYKQWPDSSSWAEYMVSFVYFRHFGDDAPVPSEKWIERTRQLIELGQRTFPDADNLHQFLIFYDLDQAPIHASADMFLGDLRWEDALELYSGGGSEGRVEGPFVESFDVPGAETGMRALRYTEIDPEAHAIAADYNYAFRKHGLDVVVRALFVDLSTLHDALPAIDVFVRGIDISFGDADA